MTLLWQGFHTGRWTENIHVFVMLELPICGLDRLKQKYEKIGTGENHLLTIHVQLDDWLNKTHLISCLSENSE